MIDWKEGVACFGNSRQWPVECIDLFYAVGGIGTFGDFQLNEMREGDYIKASELDTEQKHNDAVEVFELFGFKWGNGALSRYSSSTVHDALTCCDDGLWQTAVKYRKNKRKLTYPQLMAIGELKRAMIEREKAVMVDKIKAPKPVTKAGACNELGVPIPFKPKRSKSKQAYAILKSLDYEYDLVKQQWYKKAYI